MFFSIPRKFRIRLLLLFGTGLYFFANFQRIAVPGSIFDELQSGLGISAASVTALGAAFMYIYAINQIFIGPLVDRYGGIRVISAGALLFCLGAVIFPLSDWMPMLYFSRGLVGLGAGTIYLSLVKETARAFPDRFAVMLGGELLLGYIGGVAANAPFLYCVEEMGWRMSLLVIAAMMTFCFGMFFVIGLTVRKPTVCRTPFSLKPFAQVFSNRGNLFIYASLGTCFGIYYMIHTAIGKKFLEDYCLMTAEGAAWIVSLMGIIAAGSSFFSAVASQMLGGRRKPFFLLMGFGTAAALGTILAALILGIRNAGLIGGAVCFLTLICNIAPVNVALLRETNPGNLLGTAVSSGNAIAYTVVAVLGNVTGEILDSFHPEKIDGVMIYPREAYLSVFLLLFLLSIPTAIAALNVPESGGKMRVR